MALRPLTDGHIQNLVETYLNLARGNQRNGIAPFSEECLELIHQRSQGNVRQILTLCSRILDEAVEQEQDAIQYEFVEDLV